MCEVCLYDIYLHVVYTFTIGTGEFDQKPWFENPGTKGDIYLKVKTGVTDYFMICGIYGESFKHSTIMMDLHAGEGKTKDDLKDYSFGTRDPSLPPLVIWRDRKYVGSECTEIHKVPAGTHIMGIARNETLKTDHVSSLIHLIVW